MNPNVSHNDFRSDSWGEGTPRPGEESHGPTPWASRRSSQIIPEPASVELIQENSSATSLLSRKAEEGGAFESTQVKSAQDLAREAHLQSAAEKLRKEQAIHFVEGVFVSLDRDQGQGAPFLGLPLLSRLPVYPEARVQKYVGGLPDHGRKRLAEAFHYYCETKLSSREMQDNPVKQEIWLFLKEFCSNPQHQVEILAEGKFYQESYNPGLFVKRIAWQGKAYLKKFEEKYYQYLKKEARVTLKTKQVRLSLPLAFGGSHQKEIGLIDPVPSFLRLVGEGVSIQAAAKYIADKLTDIDLKADSIRQFHPSFSEIKDDLSREYSEVHVLWERHDRKKVYGFLNGFVTSSQEELSSISEEKAEPVEITKWVSMAETYCHKKGLFAPHEEAEATVQTYCRREAFQAFITLIGTPTQAQERRTPLAKNTIWLFRQIQSRGGVSKDLKQRLEGELQRYWPLTQWRRFQVWSDALSYEDQYALFFRSFAPREAAMDAYLKRQVFEKNKSLDIPLQKVAKEVTKRFFRGESFERLRQAVERLEVEE